MRYKITVGLLLLVKLVVGQDQQITKLDGSTISAAQIDQTVTRLMDAANVQGLNLAILNNNRSVFIKSYFRIILKQSKKGKLK